MRLRFGFLVMAVLASAGSATAQVAPSDRLFSVVGGYASGKSALTGSTIDGGGVLFTFETLQGVRPVSILFSFGYSSLSSDEQDPNQRVKSSTSTVPIYLGTKYWVGKGKVQGYVGAAVGIYFSTANTTVISTDETFTSFQTSGAGLGVPLGLSAALTEGVLLTGGVSLNWMWGNEFFENDLLYSANLGLVFKMGS